MFVPTSWHRLLRPTTSLFRHHVSVIQPRVLHTSSILRLRASPTQQFRATDFFNATHRSTLGHGRPPRPPGPFQRFRRKFDSLSHYYIMGGILGINIAVFASWSYVSMLNGTWSKIESVRDFTRWLDRNFINSRENIRNDRYWTLVTSAFSHAEPWHAFLNGATFWFLAPPALMILGNAQFLALYLGGSVFSSIVSLAWNNQREYRSHGASGAVYSLASFFAFAMPRSKFLLFFVLPMPAWACIGGIACFDVYNAITHRVRGLDSAGHVGGLTAGALYWFMRTRFRVF
ncbi:hypothetical protein BC834DRAFT_619780 [Gloeopeniophorella convolvens]|nr:hypothetical protein BC834DRAFT_619780 [Gloeopeniophorella convolvens]